MSRFVVAAILVCALTACADNRFNGGAYVPYIPDTKASVNHALGAKVPGEPVQRFHERTVEIERSDGYRGFIKEREIAGSRSGEPFMSHHFDGYNGQHWYRPPNYHYRRY